MTPAEKQAAYRARRAAREGRPVGQVGRPPTVEHGTPGQYRRGCTCDHCRQAHAQRIATWRAQRKDTQ